MNVFPGTKMFMFFFQENTCVDTRVAVDWVKKTAIPHTKHLKRFASLAYNVTGQVHEDFKENVTDCSSVVWYGLPNATDLWQPVDAGYGKVLKTLMEQEHHSWLDDEEHADRWYGNEELLSAKERRNLITHWAGEAYKKLCGDEYNEFRKTLWLNNSRRVK